MKKNLAGNEKKVILFLKMLENIPSSAELENIYHPDIEQSEYANAVTKNISVRNLDNLKAAFESGRKILAKQQYEIKNLFSLNNIVLLEAIWKGTMAVPVGKIAAGGIMTAYFAQIFEFKDGKIFRQRNYDCFEPF